MAIKEALPGDTVLVVRSHFNNIMPVSVTKIGYYNNLEISGFSIEEDYEDQRYIPLNQRYENVLHYTEAKKQNKKKDQRYWEYWLWPEEYRTLRNLGVELEII